MLRIISCIKAVPDNVEANMHTGTIQRDKVTSKINPLDLNAIEEAIRIKEKKEAFTIGLCMGVKSAENQLKYGIAMGLDEMYLLTDPIFAGSDTYATSLILSKAIKKIGMADLVICGNQTTDGATGQIPQELAVHLGVPCIINVVDIQIINSKHIKCIVAMEGDYCCVNVELPAVIGVLKEINEPRVPTIAGILKAEKVTIKKIDHMDIGIININEIASCTQIKATRYLSRKERPHIDITDSYCNKLDDVITKTLLCMRTQPVVQDDPDLLCINVNTIIQKKEIWVVCEKTGQSISTTSWQLLSKAHLIAGNTHYVCAVLPDRYTVDIVESLVNFGVDKIYRCNHKHNGVFDEIKLEILIEACRKFDPDVVLFEGSTQGRWLAASIAASLRTGLTADCVDLQIDTNTGLLIQTRVAFSGSIIADIVCLGNRPQMATIRDNVFEKISFTRSQSFSIVDLDTPSIDHIRIKSLRIHKNKPSCLRQSDIILCGGRGIGGRDGFILLNKLASLLGATVGATRVAVDSKWIDYSHQIGQTGLTVKPKVYIAFGVSGAIEHTIGMDRTDCIISVNNDKMAPICRMSDYIIVDDCINVINSLIEYYESKKGEPRNGIYSNGL